MHPAAQLSGHLPCVPPNPIQTIMYKHTCIWWADAKGVYPNIDCTKLVVHKTLRVQQPSAVVWYQHASLCGIASCGTQTLLHSTEIELTHTGKDNIHHIWYGTSVQMYTTRPHLSYSMCSPVAGA